MQDFNVDGVPSVGISLEPNEVAFLLGMLEVILSNRAGVFTGELESLEKVGKATYEKLKGFVEAIELASK